MAKGTAGKNMEEGKFLPEKFGDFEGENKEICKGNKYIFQAWRREADGVGREGG